jgi:hypothetical protein
MGPAIALLFLFASACFGQVYAVTVTNGGSGYTGTPTATASGGSCTTEPTFGTITPSSGVISSIPITYAGVCTPGGTAPTVAIAGTGTGATATAVMLQANIAILDTPTVISDSNPQVSISGTNKLYRYECTLTVPALFVPFYSSALSTAVVDRMPNTSQSSSVVWSAISGASALQPLYNTAFAAGILTVYDGVENVNASTSLATVEGILVSNCAAWQTDLNAWNPWVNYGTFYNGTSWTSIGIP